jgi:hypothetical protein
VVASRRWGRTAFGCLLSILLVVTAVYFAVNVGEPYFRYYRFLDGMKQEARFSARFTDDQIEARLAALADSLGLPEAAGRVRVRRTSNRISLSSSYYERVEMPLIVREILFSPQAEWTY